MNKLMLSKELYNSTAIIKTVSAFSELVNISVTENNKYYICYFNNSRYGTKQTISEFENYLIDLCNRMEN